MALEKGQYAVVHNAHTHTFAGGMQLNGLALLAYLLVRAYLTINYKLNTCLYE